VHVAAIVAAASGCGGSTVATASRDDGGTTDGGNPGEGGSGDATTGDVGSGGQDASAMDGEAGGSGDASTGDVGNGGQDASATDGEAGCDGTTCGTDGGGDGGGPCVPTTCAMKGYTCGVEGDGCGGLLDCGTCVCPDYCGGGGFNKCGGNNILGQPGDGGDACAPTTCNALGYNCGAPTDGCGGTLNCGSCTNPQFCGGGGSFTCGGNDGLDAAPDSPLVGCGDSGVCARATVTASTACQMLEEIFLSGTMYVVGPTCLQACAEVGVVPLPGIGSLVECVLPQSYVSDVQSLNPDGGSPADGGAWWTLVCPTSPATLTVTCTAVACN
jgi:hypothetical protein